MIQVKWLAAALDSYQGVRREPDVQSFLAHLPLFEGLRTDELKRLAAGTTRRRLRSGETLFRRGEPASGFHAVVHGRIALLASSVPGRERVSAIVEAGRSFGEAIMFLEKPYIVTARALTDALVLHIGKEAVFAELEHNPGFGRRIIATLSAKLQATVNELETYSFGPGSARLAAWLLREAPPTHQDGAAVVMLPAAKRAIASQLNLSAEHLSRILRELAHEGLIEVHGREIRIPDVARLRDWNSTRQP